MKFLGESVSGRRRAESPRFDPWKVPYTWDTAGNYLLEVTEWFWKASASI